HLVDLARRDVLAALDDELLDAPGDEEVAFGIAHADVAAAQPSIGKERRPGGRLVLVVAGSHLRAADRDLARRAVGKRLAVLVDDARLASGGLADRAHLALRRLV